MTTATDEKFTMSRVLAMTGAHKRQIDTWCDRGVLIPVPGTHDAGTGIPRQYTEDEVLIAAVLVQLKGVTIGQLKKIADEIRRKLLVKARDGWVGGQELNAAKIKAANSEPVWLVVASNGTDGGDDYRVGVVHNPGTTTWVETEAGGRGLSNYKRVYGFNLEQIWGRILRGEEN